MSAFAAALAIVVALAEIALDLGTPLQLDLAAIYAIPLVLAAYTRRRLLLWSLTFLLGVAAVVIYELHARTLGPSMREQVLVNRLLDLLALLLTTGVLHVWLRSLDVRESQARLLAEQNRRLATANDMLVEHEAQIVRQNGELQRRHQEDVASSERRSQFLAAVSHDIRTPINTIGLVAELIRRTAEDPGLVHRVPQMAERLQANAVTLLTMVSDLLDLSRFESGHAALNPSTFALGELATAKCRELGPLAESKSLALAAHVSPAPLWVRSDRIKVERVLANLIGNAIKFTAKGSVTVTAGVNASGSPMLQVADTGRGVEPEVVERIFDEYAQAGDGAGDAERGWGLGLAISRRLAEALRATIDVVSVPGRGSTFTLVLPADCRVEIAPLELSESVGKRSAN